MAINRGILLKCIGGLGNQLFQIAFAYSLSKKYNLPIYIDRFAYENYAIRNYGLGKLNISKIIKEVKSDELSRILMTFYKLTQILYRIYQYAYRKIKRNNRLGNWVFSNLQKIGLFYNFDRYYYPVRTPNTELICLYGYFQSKKYFQEYERDLKNLLKISDPYSQKEIALLTLINSSNSIAISIRLGDDYLADKSLNIFEREYYIKSINYTKSKVDNPVYFIFSDAVDRVKSIFNFPEEFKYVEGFNEYESLRLMYSCQHFIISNSSFSWWGAYLSNNNNKIVIAPKKWYSDNDDEADIYNEEMLRI